MEDPRRGSSMPLGAAEIFAPSSPVQPPQACTALWYKRRRGDTELCGALAGCPLSRLAATALPKGEPSLASPFGGRWCPVGTVQRLTEPAGESAPTGGGEGKLPAAPSHGLYRSAGGLPSQSRLPPPSGCGSLPAKPPRRQGKSLDKEEPLVLYW